MKSFLSLLLLSFFFCGNSMAQDDLVDVKTREIGINMSSLISQLVPFQEGTTLTGAHQLIYRGGVNDRLFSLKVGADFDIFEPEYLNISLGYVRRRTLNKHFSLNIGYHLMGFGGSLNDPVNREEEIGAVGFGWEIGIQYHFADRISLYTSSTLFGGPSTEGVLVTFLPPVGIFLVAQINK